MPVADTTYLVVENGCGPFEGTEKGSGVDVNRRRRGSLEQEVLATLAAAGRPLTPGEVRDGLDDDLAYTTVMTVLARLYDKGMVTRQRAGRAFAYAAVLDESVVIARQMRRLLDAGEDRVGVLSRFVGALSDADEQVLAELLRRAEEDAS